MNSRPWLAAVLGGTALAAPSVDLPVYPSLGVSSPMRRVLQLRELEAAGNKPLTRYLFPRPLDLEHPLARLAQFQEAVSKPNLDLELVGESSDSEAVDAPELDFLTTIAPIPAGARYFVYDVLDEWGRYRLVRARLWRRAPSRATRVSLVGAFRDWETALAVWAEGSMPTPRRDAASGSEPAVSRATRLVLLAGTPVTLRLTDTMPGPAHHLGSRLQVVDDVSVDGLVLVAKGAGASFSLVEKQPGRWGKPGELVLHVDAVRSVIGHEIPIIGSYGGTGEDRQPIVQHPFAAATLPLWFFVKGGRGTLQAGSQMTALVARVVTFDRSGIETLNSMMSARVRR